MGNLGVAIISKHCQARGHFRPSTRKEERKESEKKIEIQGERGDEKGCIGSASSMRIE